MSIGKFNFNRGGEILTVILQAEDGQKLDTRRCQVKNQKELNNLFRWLKEKYGINPVNNLDNKESNETGWLDSNDDFLK